MRFDGTVTLGGLLQIASMFVLAVSLFNALSARMTVFQNSLTDHAKRLDRQEASMLDVIKNLQRLIGQVDHRQDRR